MRIAALLLLCSAFALALAAPEVEVSAGAGGAGAARNLLGLSLGKGDIHIVPQETTEYAQVTEYKDKVHNETEVHYKPLMTTQNVIIKRPKVVMTTEVIQVPKIVYKSETTTHEQILKRPMLAMEPKVISSPNLVVTSKLGKGASFFPKISIEQVQKIAHKPVFNIITKSVPVTRTHSHPVVMMESVTINRPKVVMEDVTFEKPRFALEKVVIEKEIVTKEPVVVTKPVKKVTYTTVAADSVQIPTPKIPSLLSSIMNAKPSIKFDGIASIIHGDNSTATKFFGGNTNTTYVAPTAPKAAAAEKPVAAPTEQPEQAAAEPEAKVEAEAPAAPEESEPTKVAEETDNSEPQQGTESSEENSPKITAKAAAPKAAAPAAGATSSTAGVQERGKGLPAGVESSAATVKKIVNQVPAKLSTSVPQPAQHAVGTVSDALSAVVNATRTAKAAIPAAAAKVRLPVQLPKAPLGDKAAAALLAAPLGGSKTLPTKPRTA